MRAEGACHLLGAQGRTGIQEAAITPRCTFVHRRHVGAWPEVSTVRVAHDMSGRPEMSTTGNLKPDERSAYKRSGLGPRTCTRSGTSIMNRSVLIIGGSRANRPGDRGVIPHPRRQGRNELAHRSSAGARPAAEGGGALRHTRVRARGITANVVSPGLTAADLASELVEAQVKTLLAKNPCGQDGNASGDCGRSAVPRLPPPTSPTSCCQLAERQARTVPLSRRRRPEKPHSGPVGLTVKPGSAEIAP